MPKGKKKKLAWPWPHICFYAPGPWTGKPFPLQWDWEAQRIVGAYGAISSDALFYVYEAFPKPEIPLTWAADWLRRKGYRNCRIADKMPNL